MHIRGWLTGLIVFLLAPSLLFAFLWFYNKFESVSAIDKSLDGLHITQALGPLIQEKAISGTVGYVPASLRNKLTDFGGTGRAGYLIDLLDKFTQDEDVNQSLRQGRELALAIAQMARLTTAGSYETSKLPYLLNDMLLSVVIESSKMAENARRLSKRNSINVWDKMSIPVQGGQFKVAADGAARETVQYFDYLIGPNAEDLRQKAVQFRSANLQFQSKGSKLLSSTIKGTTGEDIISEPVIAAHPELIHATFMLWQGILDYMNENLEQQRSQTLFAVSLAGFVGALVIFGAFGIAVALSRALADRTQQEFENLGYHDPLTGLPNRRALLDKMRDLPQSEDGQGIGLIVFDLRQFKKINNQYGDQTGDAILRLVGEQMTCLAEPEDFLSRTGGSEFVLLRPALKDQSQFEKFAKKVVQSLAMERPVDGQKVVVEVNAGLYINQAGSPATDRMLIDATLALRSAKKKGPRQSVTFVPEMRVVFEKHSETANELLDAIDEGNIVPWFQPQVDINTGKIVGAEALVRWVDSGGVRYPGSFLPAAEDAGYMKLIEATVRQQAFNLATTLNTQTDRCIHLGLNVSADLLGSAKAADALHQTVLDLGLKPSDFSLEILEAVMIDETAANPIKENIAHLSDLGFFIELDDFGTGHSSISSLRDLHVDRVKIDRSFVFGVNNKPELQKFTSALINLAKSLDISVLAEGVETEEERCWLQQNGCDVIQGFLISKAVPQEQLMTMILRQDILKAHPSTDTLHVVQA